MKKIGLMLCFVLLLSVFSFALVSAEDNNSVDDSNDSAVLISAHDDSNDSGSDSNNSVDEMRNNTNRERINEMKDKIEKEKDKIKEMQDKIKELKDKIQERKGEFKIEGKNVNVSQLNDNQKEFIVNKIYAKTGLNLSIDDLNGTVGSIMRAYMSNGEKAEIRVMPDVASEKAREKMKVRCEERNCTFELKEVRKGNESRAVYEVKAQKEAKLFGLFKKKMEIQTEIDALTGNASDVKKPWWAFLASEQEDNVTSVENNSTVVDNSTNSSN